jgi:hypothetical protein
MVHKSETSPVYLVCLVQLVSSVQPNRRDRPNRPNKQDRLAGFFSILLDEVSAGVELVLSIVDQADNAVVKIPVLILLG